MADPFDPTTYTAGRYDEALADLVAGLRRMADDVEHAGRHTPPADGRRWLRSGNAAAAVARLHNGLAALPTGALIRAAAEADLAAADATTS